MLVKIAKAPYFQGSDNNSFMLIQAQEIIRFKTQPYWQFDSVSELEEQFKIWKETSKTTSCVNIDKIMQLLKDEEDENISLAQLHEQKVYCVNYILLKDMEGKEAQYIFDTIAYICNDKGETLEKCFAGGILNK